MTEKEALKLALEALERVNTVDDDCDILSPSLAEAVVEAIDFAKEALAQPEQEPCCYGGIAHDCRADENCRIVKRIKAVQPEQEPVAKVVSTAPERIWLDLGFDPSDEDEISFDDLIDATWSHDNATGYGIEYVRADTTTPQRLPLTDEQIAEMWPLRPTDSIIQFARAIEAAHGIKELA